MKEVKRKLQNKTDDARPRIAIVGGAGFVGNSLAKYLSRKFRIKVLDNRPSLESLDDACTYAPCDIRSVREVIDGIKDSDLVIHTAIVQIPLINDQKSLGYAVNILGTQNICRAIEENPRTKGMILSGTWHTIGERDLSGVIDEEFGFRPDKVEDRARLYALSKIAQEAIVRYHDEMSTKTYGIVRMGTVLGAGMPKETAASIFIEKGLRGEAITPFRHSMYRPMLYVDIEDVCRAYEIFAFKILSGKLKRADNSLEHIVNLYYPKPMTILDLARSVRKSIIRCTDAKVKPRLRIVNKGFPKLFNRSDKDRIVVSIKRAERLLEMKRLTSPEESLTSIVKLRLKQHSASGG
jgi:nucleoside-diphosphate-sugar epimerase